MKKYLYILAFSLFFNSLYSQCEDGEFDCVENDREKLTDSPYSDALKSWIRDCIEDLSQKIYQKTLEYSSEGH